MRQTAASPRAVVGVSTPRDSILVVSNTFGPWWQCRDGERRLETFRVYHVLLGVPLGPGEHHVMCAVDANMFDVFSVTSRRAGRRAA